MELKFQIAPMGYMYRKIIVTPHHYAYFMEFDCLEEMFYTSINAMSRNLENICLPPASKTYNYADKNTILMTKLEL